MTYPRIWAPDHGVCADLERIRGTSSAWLRDKGFPSAVLQAMEGQPEPPTTVQQALNQEVTTRGIYRYASNLESLDPQVLIQLLCAFRWRVDWALWCNAELRESLLIRNRSRQAEDQDSLGYWDETLSCPLLIVESLPVYDSSNLLCRRLSGMLSARLSVFDKVTIVLTDTAILERYPAHQQYLSFQQLFPEVPE